MLLSCRTTMQNEVAQACGGRTQMDQATIMPP